MKKKEIFKLITDQFIKNIWDVTEGYSNTLHQLYREGDFTNEEVEWIFGDLENKCGRFGSYLIDKENYLYHEEDIYFEAKKAKENYDNFL